MKLNNQPLEDEEESPRTMREVALNQVETELMVNRIAVAASKGKTAKPLKFSDRLKIRLQINKPIPKE
jgi:hypothetical protein